MTCRRACTPIKSAESWENPSADDAEAGVTSPSASASSWWACGVLALLVGSAVSWLVIFYEPHTLSDLGRQMIGLAVTAVCLAPVLLINSPEETQP